MTSFNNFICFAHNSEAMLAGIMESINTDITENSCKQARWSTQSGDNVWVQNGEPMCTDVMVNKYRQTMTRQCRHKQNTDIM